jgi:cellulose synthase/poly-beta-1,6-N-acetylglucosamine synthase-like glycosyltransferase/uncharacterized membrane protein
MIDGFTSIFQVAMRIPEIDVLSIISAVLGLIWIMVNLYMFYPLVRSLLPDRFRSQSFTHIVNADRSVPSSPPSFDILIPAYKESDVIHQAIASVRNAEYPNEHVNLVVLTEPGDTETRDALSKLADEYRFTTLVVPEEYPGEPNKPRALNYGFERTVGDIVGVIDAENIIAPGLFAKASEAVTDGGCDYVQGRVDMVNEDDGWINTLFRAEYGHWYNYIVPAHFRASYPIPLSGTTCFFSRDALSEISDCRIQKYGIPWNDHEREWLSTPTPERDSQSDHITSEPVAFDGSGVTEGSGCLPWNPENVTEDFELGLFLWDEGYELGLVKSFTEEESPLDVDAWLKQRTRWQKGKVQTFLQYLRNPPSEIDSKFHILWQSVLPHLGPINVLGVVFLLLIANMIPWSPGPVAAIILIITLFFIPVVMFVYVYGYWTTSDVSLRYRGFRAFIVFVSLPLYWLLQWIADIRALKQVYVGDLHWEKTTHLAQDEKLQQDLGTIDRIAVIVYRSRLLLPVVAVGLFFRLFRLGEQSYWLDEIYSVVYRGQMPVRRILLLTQESHPPLYYVLLHYWTGFFGTSPSSARLLSAIFGVGSIIAIYFLGKTLFDREAGLIVALLLAVSTFHIHQSRTARMYSLLVLLAIISTYFFWRLVRTRSYSMAIWYVVTTGLLALTHLFAVFVVVAQNVYVLTRWISSRESSPPISLRYWFTIQSVVGLLALPWILLLGGRILRVATGAGEGNIGWIRPPSLSYLIETVLVYFGHPNFYPIMGGTELTTIVSAGMAILAILVVFATSVSMQIDPWGDSGLRISDIHEQYLLVLLFGMSAVIPLVLSYLLTPVFVIRNTIIASVALYLLIAGSLVRLPNAHIRYAMVALMVSAALFTSVTYLHTDTEEKWEQVIENVDAQTDSSDLIILHPSWINTTFAYYTNDGSSDSENPTVMSVSRSQTVQFADTSTKSGRMIPKITNTKPDRLIHAPDTIWVINYGSASINSKPLLETLRQSRYRHVSYTRTGIIEVYVFVSPEHASTSHSTEMNAEPMSALTTNCGTNEGWSRGRAIVDSCATVFWPVRQLRTYDEL